MVWWQETKVLRKGDEGDYRDVLFEYVTNDAINDDAILMNPINDMFNLYCKPENFFRIIQQEFRIINSKIINN